MGARARWTTPARPLAIAVALLAAVTAPASPRIVAVGDVHGAIGELDAVLRHAGLIDSRGDWAGGDAVLVQTGDFMDRGPRVRAVMDRLRGLQGQARAAGGAVHVLLGNHEAMNLLLFMRDVDPETWAEFAGPESEQKRRAALRRCRTLAGEDFDPQAWLDAHPAGRLEYAESLGPDGEYGRWLRRLPASVRVGDTVFVHGGFSDELAFDSPEELDRAVSAYVERFDEARRYLLDAGLILPSFDLPEIDAAVVAEVGRLTEERLTGRAGRSPRDGERHREALLAIAEAGRSWALRTDSPLWFRGYATWGAEEGARRVGELLERFHARRFVVGHTVIGPPGRIQERFGGRVFLIDTGMLAPVYGGRGSALEIAGGLVRALYPGADDEVLWGDVPSVAASLAPLRVGVSRHPARVPRMTSAVGPPGQLLDFSERTVLVTGAGSGIGSGIALRFAQAGAAVAVNYRSSADGARRVVEEIASGGGRAVALQADVTRRSEVATLVEAVCDALGGVDVLVNNAGLYPLQPLLEMDDASWDQVVDSNLRSTFLCTQAVARHMKDTGRRGAIVNVASIEGTNPAPAHSHYDAAKGGVLMHTRAAAQELGPSGIRVNAVSPGLIWREGLDAAWPDGVERYRRAAPLGRLGEFDDVADACLFLASPLARWVTGSELVVDGGVLCHQIF